MSVLFLEIYFLSPSIEKLKKILNMKDCKYSDKNMQKEYICSVTPSFSAYFLSQKFLRSNSKNPNHKDFPQIPCYGVL